VQTIGSRRSGCEEALLGVQALPTRFGPVIRQAAAFSPGAWLCVDAILM
jgi:hypothetical protein